MAKLTCYGGAGSATGANFLLEIGGRKIMIDCGMEQGARSLNHNRKEFPYDPSSIDFLFVTHAHIDHTGLIPKLVRSGFAGEIYSTRETRDIAELLLLDAVKINQEGEAFLYDAADVSKALSLWRPLSYHSVKDFDVFSVELFDAGHVLGSAMVKLASRNGNAILCTGDIGNSPSPLLREAERVEKVGYLLMESVYGDRNHEERELREAKFAQVVRQSIGRGGTLLIPAFSLERTQMLLSELDNLFESGRLPPVPVYLDSPLAVRITAIYERVTNLYNSEAEKELRAGDDLFKFPELKETVQIRDSRAIANVPGPKIVIAGSGMSTAGRILGHEKHYLPDPDSTILFTGYQAAGTLGRQIEEGIKKVEIDGREVPVRARIEKIQGFSGHADSDALVRFVSASAGTLKKVFVAMGEPKAQIFLAQRLRDELDLDAVSTEEGKSYEVDL